MWIKNSALALTTVALVFVVYKWERARYSEQRVYDVACRVAGDILEAAENKEEPLPENMRKVKKMLQSPRRIYTGLPFELVGHSESGMNTHEIEGLPRFLSIDPNSRVTGYLKDLPSDLIERDQQIKQAFKQEAGDGDSEMKILVNGRKAQLGDLPDDLRRQILHDVEQAKNRMEQMGYEAEIPSHSYLLDSMRRARDSSKVLLVSSTTNDSMYNEFRKAVRQSEGEQMTGLVVIAVSESPSLSQLQGILAGTGVTIRTASYKFSVSDLLAMP
jgi:hypothetical protein